MEKLEIYCYTDEKGLFHVQNHHRLIEWARANPNRQLLMRVDKRSSRRSNQQSRYHWGVVVQEVKLGFLNIGYEMSAEETHYFLKEKFNSISIENKDGVNINVPGSTTQLTKTQFGEYVERIARFAAEFLSIKIPQPNESMEMKFE